MARKETPTRKIDRWITAYGDPPSGYFVRPQRAGKKYHKYFRVRGSTAAKALHEAKRYAQSLHLPKIQSTRDMKTSRNTSGKVGVHFSPGESKKWPNSASPAYIGSWHREGKHVHVSFAWGKYGEDAAWEMASIARDNELRDRDRILRMYEGRKKRKGK